MLKAAARYLAYLGLALVAYLAVAVGWAISVSDDVRSQFASQIDPIPLSKQQEAVLLAVEDPTFYQHPGLDISNGQGLTTLTSSLAARLYLSELELSGWQASLQTLYGAVFNCCKRIDIGRDAMALILDRTLSKEEQLAIFLRQAFFGISGGEAVIGLEQASKAYLDLPSDSRSEPQFAGLVGMLLAPRQFHPIENESAHAERAERIVRLSKHQCAPAGWTDLIYESCAD